MFMLPDKKLGQNFLQNESVLDVIIDAGEVFSDDHVLEIGPGLGVLTKRLIDKAGQVLAVELDDRFIEPLLVTFKSADNFRLIHGSILDKSNEELIKELYKNKNNVGSYKVIANIPYMITSPIIRKYTEQLPVPDLCVFLVQKEVGERLAASPGSLSILGVTTQFYAEVSYIMTVPARDFSPVPDVDSCVIRLRRHSCYHEKAQSYGLTPSDVFRFVRIGFSSRRKQLHNNLSAGLHLERNDIFKNLESLGFNKNIRAQELSVSDWIKLSASFRFQ